MLPNQVEAGFTTTTSPHIPGSSRPVSLQLTIASAFPSP